MNDEFMRRERKNLAREKSEERKRSKEYFFAVEKIFIVKAWIKNSILLAVIINVRRKLV